MEIYREIVGFEKYEVSNFGNVRNKTNNKIMKQSLDKDGYKKLNLRNMEKAYTRVVHRLVAKEFLANDENKNRVRHIDGNKTNNNVNNLVYF